MNDLRNWMEEIARGAGEITLRYFNKPNLEIITKSDASPVTRADRESEEYLRKRIREKFPNDKILGEEFGEDTPSPGLSPGGERSNERRWILDPIDGTQSFIRGVPLYGVMIALEESGIITHGCVHFPALNEMISASRGHGCFWNDERCRVSKIERMEDATLLATDFRRLEGKLPGAVRDTIIRKVKTVRGWGDCYGHFLVATGRADIMLDPKVALWDTAPLGVIVEEAGGRALDFSGNDTVYSPTLITTNGELAAEVKEMLRA